MNAIENLRELMKKATPGPWKSKVYVGAPPAADIVAGKKWITGSPTCDEASCDLGDAELIVAMHAALPRLLAVVEAAQLACQEETRAGIYHEAVKEQRIDCLRAALAPLTTPKE